MLRRAVRNFATRELLPIAAEIDRDDEMPSDMFRRLGSLGVLGVTIPEEYGGAGADLLAGVLVIEEIAKASASVALSYGAHANLCANNVNRNGTEEQRRRYLPGLCSGELIGALALTEPNAGSDSVSIETTAVRDGDDYVLNGTKMFITNGPIADVLVVYAKTDRSKGSHGITAFIVESSFPGFSVARKLDKIGHRGSPTGELLLEDCRVPARNVLGTVD
ncbi:MAG: acyl-CoA dehydrogenase family protein, partial [Dehalococcoidia bacterium]